MYEADFSAEHIEKAYEALRLKEDVCEVRPFVRLTVNEKYTPRVTLLCRHGDFSLNCGTAAEHCRRCLDKEKQYKANERFNQGLKEMAVRLGVAPADILKENEQ